MRNDRENLIVKLSLEFALDIICYTELLESQKRYVIARQLLNQLHQLGQMLEKRKMLKAKQILFIKSKSPLKKSMKLNIG